MSSFLRRFRGLGIALAVLAISAGAVFAAAPSMTPVASHASDQAQGQIDSSEPADSADPSESPEPSESAEPAHAAAPAGSPEAAGGANPDTHGALVSQAAQMPTPSGFPNHGAFVSCVAHMNASATGFDWTTVTPASCGITPASPAQTQSGHGQGAVHGAAGKAHANGHGKAGS
jgi:hypothetical protein